MADKIGRNDSCPCGSGKKYKMCCLQASSQRNEAKSFSHEFRFEPGSYGVEGSFVSSIACFKQTMPEEWNYHFVLVKPVMPYAEEYEAASIAEEDLQMAFLQKERIGSEIAVAEYLRAQGYVSVTGFKVAETNGAEGFRESKHNA